MFGLWMSDAIDKGLVVPVYEHEPVQPLANLPKVKGKPCPYLENNRCVVYDKRPEICRTYPVTIHCESMITPSYTELGICEGHGMGTAEYYDEYYIVLKEEQLKAIFTFYIKENFTIEHIKSYHTMPPPLIREFIKLSGKKHLGVVEIIFRYHYRMMNQTHTPEAIMIAMENGIQDNMRKGFEKFKETMFSPRDDGLYEFYVEKDDDKKKKIGVVK
jgi:Fe-S-cluster containining protein